MIIDIGEKIPYSILITLEYYFPVCVFRLALLDMVTLLVLLYFLLMLMWIDK